MFFLCFNRTRNPIDNTNSQRDVFNLLKPFGAPDKKGVHVDEQVVLAQCVTYNTRSSTLEPTPFHCSDQELYAASWARIDNRPELTGQLGLTSSEVDRMSDTELICRTYSRFGEDSVNRLIGDFAFVIYDKKTNTIFCGRDHMGVRPLYYYLSDDLFICASSLPPLVQSMAESIRISRQWIVDYLTSLSMSFDQTPYIGIKKLPPGHTLTVTPNRHGLRQYFSLSTEPELKLGNSSDYVDAYREQLEIAVKCRLNTTYALGSELSGGVDSSTITAYAAKFLDRPLADLHAFAFANLEMEPQYILAVSQAFGLPHTHVLTGAHLDQDELLNRSLRVLGYPVEHGNATHHEPFYRLAETLNIRTLLSGFGGDEFSTTIHGYLVPMEMMLQHRYMDLLNILAGNPFFRFLRLVRLYLRKIKTRDFSRPEYNPRFLAAWKSRWPDQIVSRNMLETYNLKERHFDQARFDAGYTDLKKFTLENRWAPFVPTRMENCTLMAAARNIEYRWPLLDVRLVNLFLRIFPPRKTFFAAWAAICTAGLLTASFRNS